MVERYILKENARKALSHYYWKAVLVCLIATFLGSFLSISLAPVRNMYLQLDVLSIFGRGTYYSPFFFRRILFMIAALLFIELVLAIYRIFIANVVTVGEKSFFIKSRTNDTNPEAVFHYFKQGRYMNSVITMFFRSLFVFLWSLLLIIPGIIKHYEYYFVSFIMAEHPDMKWQDALERSRVMTDGEKFNIFMLEMSFLGWIILALFTCGIGLVFLTPYIRATYTEAYFNLKQKAPYIGD